MEDMQRYLANSEGDEDTASSSEEEEEEHRGGAKARVMINPPRHNQWCRRGAARSVDSPLSASPGSGVELALRVVLRGRCTRSAY